MTTLKIAALATALAFGILGATQAHAEAGVNLLATLTCNGYNSSARDDEVGHMDLTVAIPDKKPLNAFLMFSATKGAPATATDYVDNHDGTTAVRFVYTQYPFAMAGEVQLPSRDFTLVLLNNANQHRSRFTGKCTML
jgi:hypothetical protein